MIKLGDTVHILTGWQRGKTGRVVGLSRQGGNECARVQYGSSSRHVTVLKVGKLEKVEKHGHN